MLLIALTALAVATATSGCYAQSAKVYSAQKPLGLLAADGGFQRLTDTAEQPAACSTAQGPTLRQLNATVDTVNWGSFWNGFEPALVVNSGDTVDIELLSHEGGNAYDWMVEGDPNLEEIYSWTQAGQSLPFRGPEGTGTGVHLLTGPIYVCGAEPGDVLGVEILDLEPRPNPGVGGRTFGSNSAGSWGFQYSTAGFLDGDKREVITIYEVIRNAEGAAVYAQPDHSFRWAQPAEAYYAVVTPCTAVDGDVPHAAPGAESYWNNTGRIFPKSQGYLECVDEGNGTSSQTWPHYVYPGCVANQAERDYSIRGLFRVPINPHIGNMGIAPALNIPASSTPPAASIGGNIDNRRIGKGATMYYPVQVAGALLSAGDTHAAMGDAELDGTGIETSLNGKLRLTVHKQGPSMPTFLQNLAFPLLENADNYITHGFTNNDYLSELGDQAATVVSSSNKSSLDLAMVVTYNNTRDFMMQAFNLTEDQAITAITVGVDFAVAQVVNGGGAWGMHATIPKWMFNASMPSMPSGAYMPSVVPGTSQTQAMMAGTATA